MRNIILLAAAGVVVATAFNALSGVSFNGGYSLDDGSLRVIDGDTIVLGDLDQDRHVRLFGIDAPELEQTCNSPSGYQYLCGRQARDYLVEILVGTRVTCVRQGDDLYRREVGLCQARRILDGQSFDLGRAMVTAGWALDYVRYSAGSYSAAQRQAKDSRVGMWAGTFQPPWEYRWEHAR